MNIISGKHAEPFTGRIKESIKKTLAVLVSLLGVIFLIAIFALLNIAHDLNEHADDHSRLLLRKALFSRQDSIRSHLQDNAAWGEAYENLHRRVNPAWAWDKQNLGASLYKNFGYEGVFVLDGKDDTRYSILNGKRQSRTLADWLGRNPTPELRQALARSQGKPVSRLMLAQGELILLAAAWITPGSDINVTPIPGAASMLVFVDRLTFSKLQSMGLEYGIHDTQVKTPATPVANYPQASLTLPVYGGSIQLVWRSDNPGGALLTWVLPLLVFLMFATLVFAFMLMRNTLLKAQRNDENTFLLEQSRLALAASENRFRDVAEAATDWIWETDEQLRFTWISERFPAITGYRIGDWLGQPLTEFLQNDSFALTQWLKNPQSANNLTLTHCRYLSGQQRQRYCNLTLKNVTMMNGQRGFRGTATDVTLEIEAQQRVDYLSHHDELTGLPNRVQMKAFLEGKLRAKPTTERPLAMIMLDLDKFKPVNDLFGHAAGDDVLHEMSSRLRRCLGDNGLVARHGGDEFILIVPDIRSRAAVETLCQQLIVAITCPYQINGHEIFIGASMGIALAPQDATDANDLLRFADIALYQAKTSGHNLWVFYQPDMSEQIVQRREMEQALREAIRADQLRLVYQPRYDIKSAQVYAVEALVRWQHPRLGLLTPDQFIPLAEETGLIIELSDWVMLQACRAMQQTLPELALSVNISASEFQTPGLVERVHSALEQSGFPPSRFEIEVTENATLKAPDIALEMMRQLKAMGVRFLIDDFGTGYASLSYLRTFPFDGIKLDRSFVIPMADSESACLIVKNMIGLGKAYSLNVTAEGVENSQQQELLKKYECDILQGYYIGRPAPLEQIREQQAPAVSARARLALAKT
ncbi:EAL domain-containing protein [Franconibacter sp. IITDAS19]|uniref:EAL domain-containing protein n=1 Tax=Franconibacter sp. IITDAS19 TaxID=2930569 RepID=UPI0032B4D6D4